MTEPALMLHAGRMAHVRHAPFQHRFFYRMWMVSVDLDRLDATGSRLFGHNRWAPFSIADRDHGARDGSDLAAWARAQLAAAGLGAFGAEIRLMAIPRVFGWAFNPIAFYFCRDEQGRLGAVLHQVRNTFGGQHVYTLPVEPAELPGGSVRQQTGKRLHVSPFFDMAGGYRFGFRAPDFTDGARFHLVIRYGAAEAPRLTATLDLRAAPATRNSLLRALIQQPLIPVKVVVAIHFQALALWLRGARFHPVPPTQSVPARIGSQ